MISFIIREGFLACADGDYPMSETLLERESREQRLERKRRERLERERLERERREHLEGERLERERLRLLERERRDRAETGRAELLSAKEGISIPESCYIIGAGRSTVYKALETGELAASKLGRRTIILKQELLRFLAALPKADFGIKQPGTLESHPAKSDGVTPTPRFPRAKQRPAVVGKQPSQT
jgi:excisionase family DNA binding protein